MLVSLSLCLSLLALTSGRPLAEDAARPTGVYAWGNNNHGQAGGGTTKISKIPVMVALPADVTVTAVSAGNGGAAGHSLALAADGRVYAWGQNESGELGDGSTTDRAAPVQVRLPVGVAARAVSAGARFSVALASDGAIYLWGENLSNQQDSVTAHPGMTIPTRIDLPDGDKASAIATGSAHVLVLTTKNTVYAWGWNGRGQLGTNDCCTELSATPALVGLPGGTAITAIAAGGEHSLAVSSDGTVYGWGSNRHGELGLACAAQYASCGSPRQIDLPGGVRATSVAAGEGHSLAVGADGRVYAWGTNFAGELGIGTHGDEEPPTSVALPPGVVVAELDGGFGHSMALTTDGHVFSWGSNLYDQLGNDSYRDQLTPTQVPRLSGVTAISAGFGHSPAVIGPPR